METISLEFQTGTFTKLLSILNLISKLCTDATIKNGNICQLSDITKSIIVLDISELINTDIKLSRVKSKVDLLDPFRKQGVAMKLDITEPDSSSGSYIFYDDYSKIEFQKPLDRFIKNNYMSQEELKTNLSILDETPVFEYEISKFLLDRLSALSRVLESKKIKIEMKDGKGVLVINSGDNTTAKSTIGKLVEFDIANNNDDIKNSCVVFPIEPFLLGGENLIIQGFMRSSVNENKTFLLKVSTKVDDIPIVIWCVAYIVNYDEIGGLK